MSDVSRILNELSAGNSAAARDLLPLVYDELRKLADARLAQEKPGQTLQATALVHEAYLKLVGNDGEPRFANRQHFFSAAAQAMRQILVDRARRKLAVRHGAGGFREELPADLAAPSDNPELTIAVDEVLDQLAAEHARSAEVAKLRLFLQMTFREIAETLGISPDTAETDWAYARAWFLRAWR